MQLIAYNPMQHGAKSDLLQPFLRLITNINQSIMQANIYKVTINDYLIS